MSEFRADTAANVLYIDLTRTGDPDQIQKEGQACLAAAAKLRRPFVVAIHAVEMVSREDELTAMRQGRQALVALGARKLLMLMGAVHALQVKRSAAADGAMDLYETFSDEAEWRAAIARETGRAAA